MRIRYINATCLLFALSWFVGNSTPSYAQASAAANRLDKSPRHHETVQIDTKAGRKVQALVVFPEVDKAAPAVIVIHENRGLTNWERGIADQLAEAGYVAIAPDLLSQTGPNGGGTESYPPGDASREGIYKLPPEQVTDDLDAVFEYAKGLTAVNGKVTVSGFCWGGGQSFRYATHNPKLAAAFVFYGSAPMDGLHAIVAPVYGFYGGNDFRITGQVPQVAANMKELKKTYDPVTYDAAGHGFMRSGESAEGREADRKARGEAWTRWKDILSKL